MDQPDLARASPMSGGSPDMSRPSPTLSSLQRSSLNGVTSPHSMSSGPHSEVAPEELPSEESLAGRKLVILGIPWETHAETLKTYFSQFGIVQEAIVMRDRYSGKSRGFGFVTFQTTADAQRVAALDHIVDGRRCDAKLALPRGAPAASPAAAVPVAAPVATTHRIFVARIPPSVSDAEFKQYWENFGSVQDAYMPKDASKAGHRGIGFVTVGSLDVLEKAVSTTHTLHGQELAVDRAEPKLADKVVGADRFAAQAWGQMMRPGLPPFGPGMMNGRLDGLGLSRASAGGPIGPPVAAGQGLNRMSVGLYQTESAAGMPPSRQGDLPASLDLEDRRNSAASSYSAQPGSAGSYGGQAGSYGAQGASPYASNASGSYEGRSQFNPGLSELDRAALQQYALAQGFEGAVQPVSAPPQTYGRDGGVPALGRSVPALQGLTYEGSSNGLGIGYNMLQSQALPSPYMPNGREPYSPVDTQQAYRMPSGLPEAAAMRHDGLAQTSMAASLARSSMGSQSGRERGLSAAAQGPRIFVGKLSKDTTEADVKEYFSKFGFVLDVYLPRDKVMRTEHRGFGFVTFETLSALSRINAYDQPHTIRGQVIAIDDAAPRKEDDGVGEVAARGLSAAAVPQQG